MSQALNQCNFITKENFPKKALIVEDSRGCLAAAFRQKDIKTVKAGAENLMEAGNWDRDFDMVVLWNVLESFPEEEVKRIITKIVASKIKEIVLLVETKEFYDDVYDRPAKPSSWWIEKFSPGYKDVQPEAKRPVLSEDNWFYNYGLDKVMFFRKSP